MLLALTALAATAPRAHAKKPQIVSLDVRPADGDPRYCAGGTSQLVIEATHDDGSKRSTAASKGKLRLKPRELAVVTTLGEYDQQRHALFVPNTGIDLLGRAAQLDVLAKKSGVNQTIALQPGFACSVALDFSGGWGQSGAPGDDGQQGGPGQNGSPGQHGGAGSAGAPGADLEVELGLLQSPEGIPLVLVGVRNVRAPGVRTLLFDPATDASLTLDVSGGSGGAGGAGGSGGDGGDGDPGIAEGEGGDGAQGGNGGNGGNGGDGGRVTIRYDARHADLPARVRVITDGGAGGGGGAAGSAGSGGYGAEGGASGESGPSGADPGQPGAAGRAGPIPVPEAVDPRTLFQAVPGVVLDG